jgi:hypothetical protein
LVISRHLERKPKLGKDPKFPQNVHPISLLSTRGKLYEKFILRIIQKHAEERNLPNASQFGFLEDNGMTLQCMMQEYHVTINFNNNISTVVVFLDIEKAFDTTWHSGLLYKLSKLEFPTNLIKLIASLLTDRKFSLGRRGILFCAKRNSGSGASRFRLCPNIA